eukprot:6210028-Pleurochrysis_carterae.AAC.5
MRMRCPLRRGRRFPFKRASRDARQGHVRRVPLRRSAAKNTANVWETQKMKRPCCFRQLRQGKASVRDSHVPVRVFDAHFVGNVPTSVPVVLQRGVWADTELGEEAWHNSVKCSSVKEAGVYQLAKPTSPNRGFGLSYCDHNLSNMSRLKLHCKLNSEVVTATWNNTPSKISSNRCAKVRAFQLKLRMWCSSTQSTAPYEKVRGYRWGFVRGLEHDDAAGRLCSCSRAASRAAKPFEAVQLVG